MKLSMILVRLWRFGTVQERCVHRQQDFCLDDPHDHLSCRESSSAAVQSLLRPELFPCLTPFRLANPCYNTHS